MKKNVVILILVFFMGAVFISCQAHHAPVVHPQFQPLDLNAKLKSGAYMPKVNNFAVLLDASPSTRDMQSGMTSFESSKSFLYRMNRTIPQMNLNSSLRSFGHWQHGGETTLHYGPARWQAQSFQSALDGVPQGKGRSPVDQAFDLSVNDLNSMQGRTAVILVGDGQYRGVDAEGAAKRLVEQFGSNACIHTVLTGSAGPEDVATMKAIAAASQCGSFQQASDLDSPQAMANWVESVFLTRAPKKAAPAPAPMDSDGDGVYDNADQCPDTPKGATVDKRGCWVLTGVTFDTSKWEIKSRYYPILNSVVDILRKNPNLKLEIEGHTDNRGAADYNQRLSENRAKAVMDYLIARGIASNRLSARGYGFEQPAASNATAAGRAQNRRVELRPLP
ncbi:MAG: OmpA family protein [Desulfobacterales bacterium]|nr:OmpA family protein [Desulfobacterales bacterium]